MKGNNGLGNIPERDLWETKQSFWDKLNEQYGFNFDCCASFNNRKTQKFSSELQNVTSLGGHMCWMNPPFSKAKDMFENFFRLVKLGVAIYRCDNMETVLWQEVILKNADWVFIPKGRIAYTSFETGSMRGGKGCRFPSALIGVGVPAPKFLDGTTLKSVVRNE